MNSGTPKINVLDFYNLSSYISKEKIKQEGNIWLSYLKDVLSIRLDFFIYENLPELLTTQILETALMFRTNLCFAKIEYINQIVLCNYVVNSDMNIYGKPNKVNLISFNGKTLQENVNYNDIVLVLDNKLDIPPFISLDEKIRRLVKIVNSFNNALFYNDIPAIFTAPKEMVTMIEKIFKATELQKKIVVADNSTFEVKKFDIKQNLKLSELIDYYNFVKNEMYNAMGIQTQIFKKERTNQEEISSNNDLCNAVYQSMLENRQEFIKNVNDKFELNIKLKENIYQESEVKQDGEIYGKQ